MSCFMMSLFVVVILPLDAVFVNVTGSLVKDLLCQAAEMLSFVASELYGKTDSLIGALCDSSKRFLASS